MLKIHVLDRLYRHSSNVAHAVEVPPGARLLFTNGQVGTRPDGSTPPTTAEQAEVVFERLQAILSEADMGLEDVVRFDVYLTDRSDVPTFVSVRDRVMGAHKPGATILVVNGLARPELRIEIEAVAARVG
jgi:enamine deaminase RidA (YjgF/YER057c/UK114 family)